MFLSVLWFILFGVFRICNGFATTGLFATVLHVFNDTKFHDTQMSTALCITQFRYLQRNAGLNSREPFLYEACNYTDWLDSVGDIAVATAARLQFMYYVSRPDLVNALKNNPTNHFDAETFINGANYNLILNRQSLFRAIKVANADDDISDIRQKLGENLHTIQDFYSHTNWVEMGMTVVNTRVGEDNYLGVPLNSPNNPACRQCTKAEMTAAERAQLETIKNSAFSNALLKLVDFSFNDVFVCRDNIVLNNRLTSGYYGTEQRVAPKPAWKCSHGGGTDTTADNTTAVGGINKDSDSLIFSPHYYLHQEAARLSVLATIRYLEDLRLSLNDEDLFGRIIGLNEYFSIGFVIDTTASMNSSMTAIRLYVNQIIQSTTDDSVIFITPFNDPLVGTVRRFTSKDDASSYLFSLMTTGGTDGPEMCYDAVLQTIRVMPINSNVYVFTDAPSKNQYLLPTIQQISQQKNIKINYVMTGYQARDPPSYRPTNYRQKRQVPYIDTTGYQRLTRASGGYFFTPKDEAEISRISRAADNSKKNWETIIFRENVDAKCGNFLLNWTIPIDNTISALEVAITATPNTNSSILNLVSMFTDFADMKLHPDAENLLVATETVRLYRFNIVEPNSWHFYLGQVNCPSGGTFTVNVRTDSFLMANVMFFDDDSAEQTLDQPVIGKKYSIYVDCPVCGEIRTIFRTSCGSGTENLEKKQVEWLQTKNWWFVQNLTIPSSDLICIEYSGLTLKGFPFTRIHRERLTPTSVAISGRITSSDYPAEAKVVRRRNATLQYSIDNHSDQAQNLQVGFSTNRGCHLFSRSTTVFLGPRQRFDGVAEIGTDNDNAVLDSVTVSASPTSNPLAGVSSNFDFSIVDQDPDTSPPICTLISSTATFCSPKQRCELQSYSVEFEIVDHQSGLGGIYPVNGVGAWSIPGVAQSPASTVIRTTGTLSCCQNARLAVVDKNGLLTICHADSPISSSISKHFSVFSIILIVVLALYRVFHLFLSNDFFE